MNTTAEGDALPFPAVFLGYTPSITPIQSPNVPLNKKFTFPDNEGVLENADGRKHGEWVEDPSEACANAPPANLSASKVEAASKRRSSHPHPPPLQPSVPVRQVSQSVPSSPSRKEAKNSTEEKTSRTATSSSSSSTHGGPKTLSQSALQPVGSPVTPAPAITQPAGTFRPSVAVSSLKPLDRSKSLPVRCAPPQFKFSTLKPISSPPMVAESGAIAPTGSEEVPYVGKTLKRGPQIRQKRRVVSVGTLKVAKMSPAKPLNVGANRVATDRPPNCKSSLNFHGSVPTKNDRF